jgi:hypothetical protein
MPDPFADLKLECQHSVVEFAGRMVVLVGPDKG